MKKREKGIYLMIVGFEIMFLRVPLPTIVPTLLTYSGWIWMFYPDESQRAIRRIRFMLRGGF
jgi:hypothetical protein